MRLPRRIARRLRLLFRRDRAEAEMAEEMQFHLEQRAADYAADGLPDTEARYAAQRKFGNTGSLQERARDTWGWGALERARQDLRFAFRQLVGNPGFSVLAIATLGVGIGANTSMFSILNYLLLRPLPYAESSQLERFFRVTPQDAEGNFSGAEVVAFQRAKAGYGEIASYTVASVSLAEGGRPPEMVYCLNQTANYFALLGIAPQLGRDFRPEDDVPGRDRVVILSHHTWLNRFGGKTDVIGRTVRIGGEPHEIIGVMPVALDDNRHLGGLQFFRPLALTNEQAANRRTFIYRINGRPAPGRSSAEARGFVANFGRRLATEFPETNAEASWYVDSLQQSLWGRDSLSVVWMLVGLSGCVLLLACSNLANLLLARTMARAREFAVRAALGASRLQLLRPLIAEALLLSLAGGFCAVFVTAWFNDWANARSLDQDGNGVTFVLDGHVVAWTLGASFLTALAFGVAPALFALRLDLNHALKSGGRSVTGGRGHRRFRQVLIVGQFAVAMMLLTGAGLYLRGVYELNHRRAGWESEHVITGTVLLPTAKYSSAEKVTAFHRLALERLAAIPGVATVSVSMFSPVFNWPDGRKFLIADHERPPPGREPGAVVNGVSPQYFDTFGTRIIAGRAFDEHDTVTAPKVFIVSQAAARAFFGEENPLGRRIAQVGDLPAWGEIVGVAADVESSADAKPLFSAQIYQPMAQEPVQEPRRANLIAVRSTGVAASTLIDQIRKTMAGLDADLPVRRLQPLDATVYHANYQLAVLRDMLSTIALLGLALAALGIYGVMSRTMAQRMTEFAIRLVLGASLGNLVRMVLASGVKMALVGAGLGLIGAWGVARVLAAAFPAMHVNGIPVLIGTTLLLVGVALFACWLPARRAGRVDAVTLLRAE